MTVATRLRQDAGERPHPARRPAYLDFNATDAGRPSRRRRGADLHVATSSATPGAAPTPTARSPRNGSTGRARRSPRVVAAKPDEVIFTSGATESDNLAILGLGRPRRTRRASDTSSRPRSSTRPCSSHWRCLQRARLRRRAARTAARRLGVVRSGGRCSATRHASGVGDGCEQRDRRHPADRRRSPTALAGHDAFFHVDAAQAFGKVIEPLRNRASTCSRSRATRSAGPRESAPCHKARGYKRPPLEPLMFGGGQERGLRPGTLPVALIAGLGTASNRAQGGRRSSGGQSAEEQMLAALLPLGAELNGDPERTVATTLNVSIPGVDSEAAIVALKDVVALSNGSACTSQSYEPSHVLAAGRPTHRADRWRAAYVLGTSHRSDPRRRDRRAPRCAHSPIARGPRVLPGVHRSGLICCRMRCAAPDRGARSSSPTTHERPGAATRVVGGRAVTAL